MGIVYRARDPLIERAVAIKTVACAGLSKDEVAAFENRFFREAKSAGRLNHPNIVTIYDVGRTDQLAYIAMEWLEGRSLREILDSGTVLPAEKVADIAAQVADGLAYAHANGVVHRDIKPANIMVLANGSAKIADFGVALLPTSSSTLAGAVFGSPKYMSPEQVAGQRVDGRSDIFSLGAVVYEMLAGLPPFEGEDLPAVLYQVLHAQPAPPSGRRRNLAPDFDRIVAKAMAKEPQERYRDAEEMAADLRRCCGAMPARATPIPARQGNGTLIESASSGAGEAPPRGWETKSSTTFWRRPSVLLLGIAATVLMMFIGWMWGRSVAQREKARAMSTAVPAKAGTAVAVATEPAASVAVSEPQDTRPATRTPAAKATARLQLAVTPWGEIYVDGKSEGTSPPLREIRLPPGRHVVEIRNANFPPHRETVTLTARGSARIRHRFQ